MAIALSSALLGTGVITRAGTGEGVASAAMPDTRSASSATWGTHGLHDHACDNAFDGRPRGSLTKTTSAGTSGSSVLPGQTITVILTWNPRDLEGRSFSSVDCVKIGSHISASLSQSHMPGTNGGTDTFDYVMPNDTGGQPVCDRALLVRADGEGGGGGNTDQGNGNRGSGQGQQQRDASASAWGQDEGSSQGDGYVEKSAVFCYSIQPAVTPEASVTVLLPVAGMIVAGGAVFVHRRRRRPRPAA